MSIHDDGAARIHTTPSTVSTSKATSNQEIMRYAIMQEASEVEFNEWADQAFNPLAMARRFETLEAKTRRKDKDEGSEKTESKEKKVIEVKRLEEASEQFQKKNPELLARSLLLLRSRITNKDTKEEILKKVLESYPDYFLADEALDFLLETSSGDLARQVKEAKSDLNANYAREIKAGRNIAAEVRTYASTGLGNPTSLRDVYRDITGNPRDPSALFIELSNLFTYQKMKAVIDFILHCLGSDLKSKGPSISRGELHRLLTEARTLQAILGVYRFFKQRMALIEAAMKREGLTMPRGTSFETLAKIFMKYLQERYPTSDKALLLATALGITEELAAQIIFFTQMRDAVRQVAPKLYRSDQHRHDVLMSFIEAVEELDEKLEEEEEENEEDEKKEKK